MSDTAALAWALATMLFALKARERVGWSVAAGFAFGVGVLVRPASALLILPLIFAMPGSLRAWVLFGTGGAPCAGFLLWFDRISYGSALKTGYGAGGALSDFAFGNFPARFRHYLSWTSAMMTPLVPAGWLLLPGDSRRSPRVRAMLFLWFGAFFVFYCFYGPYETWWYTRYLLPAYPAAILGAVMVAEDLLRRIRERAGADGRHALRVARISTAAGVLAAIAICGAGVRVGAKFHVLQTANGQAVYPEAIRWASAIVPERSAVLAMEFSGAMRAYRWGTFVRWDYIEAPRFPEIRRRLEERGYGVYALVFPHEVREATPRVPGTWTYRGSYREVSLWRLEPLSGR
jgi:4-amino-4-deoxy-L-arabinose transferase-like glycosyltransferase